MFRQHADDDSRASGALFLAHTAADAEFISPCPRAMFSLLRLMPSGGAYATMPPSPVYASNICHADFTRRLRQGSAPLLSRSAPLREVQRAVLMPKSA